MATYDVFLGGKRTFNPDFAVFPSIEEPTLQNFAMHKAWGVHRLNRVLDFGRETALTHYINVPLVAADIIRIVQIPAPCILLAAYATVITPQAGYSFTLADADGVVAGMPVINGATINTVMTPVPVGLKNYTVNNMLQLTVTTAAATSPNVLAISVGGIFIDMDERRL